MQPVANGKAPAWVLPHQIVLSMRLLLVLITAACLQVSARSDAQYISLSVQDAPLERVILLIEQQSAYRFVYSQQAISISKPVTVNVNNENISNLLKLVFAGQPLTYTVNEKYIVLKLAPAPTVTIVEIPTHELRGKVLNDDGQPVPGLTITVKGTKRSAVTDAAGEFFLDKLEIGNALVISGAETTLKEIKVDGRSHITVTVTTKVAELDQVVMTAYGSTTKKLNTGNITKVTAEEIERQPVSNPLAALQGRVPGMIITQMSGLPGAAFRVEIRGRSSLDLAYSRNDPLFIIDGVPFEPGNVATNQIANATNTPGNVTQGGMSPLNSINPSDIESIEVLKDADATAIYGSRGANGVILITTKKGRNGKLSLSAHVSVGLSKVGRTLDMLNTQQYLAMRREAFANDGVTPTITNAPDLLAWDTTQYTDYRKVFQGGTAQNRNFQLSASGGNQATQFRIGMGYNQQTNLYDNDLSNKVISTQFSIDHSANEGKLRFTFSGAYSTDINQLHLDDLSRYKNLPPHLQLKDADGNLKWSAGGVDYTSVWLLVPNPLALFRKRYKSTSENLHSRFNVNYRLFKDLLLKVNLGYNSFRTDEVAVNPKASLAPNTTTQPYSNFGNLGSTSWIVEPQAEYKKNIGKGRMTLLAGGSLQQRVVESEYIRADNYSSDALIYSIAAAGALTASNNYEQYRYAATFGRASYHYNEKYLLNTSFRVDGSSRFGPGKRISSFTSVGAGWIFSKERFFSFADRWLSFGKLRASYGTTGNDQIGNYRYLDLWSNTPFNYQGVPGLYPGSLFNPDLNWERTRKMEAALELGFLKDRLLFSVAHYRHRSGNQLISYRLPTQAGSSFVTRNLPALVENTGWEMVLSYRTRTSKKLSYSGAVNITLPNNKLVSFPGLAASSYANSYREGYSLSLYERYQFLGVNDTTGVYRFTDYNKDGVINGRDQELTGDVDPGFYGGFQNEVGWRNLKLAVFFEFRKQEGRNFLARSGSSEYPGRLSNQPILVLDRWQRRGDAANFQRFSQSTSGPVATANSQYLLSNAVITDASYIRCKNVSLEYQLPERLLKKMKISLCQLFLQTQNLFVITRYKGSDPEIQDFYVLPPMRTIVGGIKLNF
jgi:TonB-linked SusC/RagA family outer membrane protein